MLAGSLPALDPQHVYQLWMTGEGIAHSAGLVQAHASNRQGLVAVDIPSRTHHLAITVEPVGGSRSLKSSAALPRFPNIEPLRSLDGVNHPSAFHLGPNDP
ncbi:anti-sigma factor [Amycolatopsis sp. lyj-23]|uniref:anti-sigma factor n=1 Tax=Amycolatopsis sp. lyj-23 TaxID=2789283 RepID=UPI00397D0FED